MKRLAILAIGLFMPVPLFGQLMIDIDDRGAADAANTAAGFQQFLLDGNENDDNTAPVTRSFGGVDVTISHSNGGGFGDRRRSEPTDGGAFSDQELLRDFTFARGTTTDDGLNILIESLSPNTDHTVKIWSFDDGSNSLRTSDWTANGVLVVDDYSFDGTILPADNAANSFEFMTTSDANGDILIEGRYAAGDCCSVFLNAFSVQAVPEPTSGLLAAFGFIGLLGLRRR
ncbi:MAG: PEP-CTERM sorting domain-containing protein [Planctomycetales bacterium]|nr:PEP-CTERM sorting domain-containing protein [Planctomycetales bacterium]